MKKRKDKMDTGLRAAIEAAGTKYRLAKLLRIKPQSVQKWRKVPANRILQIEQLTGVDRSRLRPDVFNRELP